MSNTDTDALVRGIKCPLCETEFVDEQLHDARVTIERLTRKRETLRHALLTCARMAEALKRPCGSDPEGGQALRNSQYQNISATAHIALGTITGPDPIEQAVARERERCKDRALEIVLWHRNDYNGSVIDALVAELRRQL